MNELSVRISVPQDKAEAVLAGIRLELMGSVHERSTVELSYDGELNLDVCARDLHAMRAAVNTYLRWVDMCVKLTE